MTEYKSHSLDILGTKPLADAVSHASKATIDGASSFLGRICLPAAEEFGLLLQDKVRAWRANNAIRVIAEAQARVAQYLPDGDCHAHPRIVAQVVEEGSWADDSTLQAMWGGLLASSCTESGRDDSNLIYIARLKQMTGIQIRVLRYACEHTEKGFDKNGLIAIAKPLTVSIPEILTIAGTEDIHRLDQDLDHLRGIEMLHGGFAPHRTDVDITPSALALNLYVRCQGFRGTAVEFFCPSKEVDPNEF